MSGSGSATGRARFLAASIGAVLIAGCIGCGQGSRPAMPSLPSIKGIGYARALSMKGAQGGWLYGAQILEHTSDGAQTFADVTPPGVDADHFIRSHHFLDAQQAWVLVGAIAVNAPLELQRTSDGGKTWSRITTITSEGTPGVIFVDSSHGWLIELSVTPDCLGATSPCSPPTARTTSVLRTTDGGLSWSRVYQTVQGVDRSTLTQFGLPGLAGFSMEKIRDCGWFAATPQFLTDLLGFASLSCPGASGPQISVTRDGGHTWKQVKLPSPADSDGASVQTNVDHLHFFSPRDGFAFVSRCEGNDVACSPTGAMLSTHDGGATWTVGATVHEFGISMQAADGANAWLPEAGVSNAQTPSLLVTSDAGLSWQAHAIPAFLLGPYQSGGGLEFELVTPSLGFALVVNPGAQKPRFYRTEDDGRTFSPFTPRYE